MVANKTDLPVYMTLIPFCCIVPLFITLYCNERKTRIKILKLEIEPVKRCKVINLRKSIKQS